MASRIKVDWEKINHPDLVFQRFASRRSVVYGTKGIVSSSQPLATAAGLEILRKGGNAGMYTLHVVRDPNDIGRVADAAVATSAALNVTEPSCCGIGGYAWTF